MNLTGTIVHETEWSKETVTAVACHKIVVILLYGGHFTVVFNSPVDAGPLAVFGVKIQKRVYRSLSSSNCSNPLQHVGYRNSWNIPVSL